MRGFYFSILLIFFMSGFIPAQKQALIPVKDFFAKPEQEAFKLSPDGRNISCLKPFQNRMNVFVRKTGSQKDIRITSVAERDITSYWWKGNERIVYLLDSGGDENFHLYSVDLKDKKAIDLTPVPGCAVRIIDLMKNNDTEMLITLNKRQAHLTDLYRVNIITGELKSIRENPGNVLDWYADNEYNLRMTSAAEGAMTNFLYRAGESENFTKLFSITPKDNFKPLVFSPDNKFIYALSDIGRDKQALVKYDLENNKEAGIIFETPEADCSGILYSGKQKEITAVKYVTWKNEIKFLDASLENSSNIIAEQLPDYRIDFVSADDNEDLFIFEAYSDHCSQIYYLFDKVKGKITKLGASRPWLKESEMCRMKPVTYQASDGSLINGYLTMPKVQKIENLPAVIITHGGPWSRIVCAFDPISQFLASRGYLVLQMNFRGSSGYGKTFTAASFKQWGKDVQGDINEGRKWLIDKGYADAKRIAIMGEYEALAAMTLSPGQYSCGVDYAAITDLNAYLNKLPPSLTLLKDQLYEKIGNPKTDSVQLSAVSPLTHAGNISVPLFIVHGAKDPIVDISVSEKLAGILKNRTIPVTYMRKENEGHKFQNEENQIEFYTELEKFLGKYLPGGQVSEK